MLNCVTGCQVVGVIMTSRVEQRQCNIITSDGQLKRIQR